MVNDWYGHSVRHKAASEVMKYMEERKMLTAEYGKGGMQKFLKKRSVCGEE